jgi:hypothetical protein
MATFLVEITNMCKATQVPETIGISGTKRFLVACRASDPKYGMSGLQALIDLEELALLSHLWKTTSALRKLPELQCHPSNKSQSPSLGRTQISLLSKQTCSTSRGDM